MMLLGNSLCSRAAHLISRKCLECGGSSFLRHQPGHSVYHTAGLPAIHNYNTPPCMSNNAKANKHVLLLRHYSYKTDVLNHRGEMCHFLSAVLDFDPNPSHSLCLVLTLLFCPLCLSSSPSLSLHCVMGSNRQRQLRTIATISMSRKRRITLLTK